MSEGEWTYVGIYKTTKPEDRSVQDLFMHILWTKRITTIASK